MPTEDVKRLFPRSHRLKSSLLIRDVMRQRHALFCFPIKCFYTVQPASAEPVKTAFMVSKKRFHHAVDRNRVKRLMREAYRLNRQEFALPKGTSANICWMFVGAELPSYTQVETAVRTILKELQSNLQSERS